MTLGEMIRTKRRELGMSQDDLARYVGTTKATVSRWETGDIHKMKQNMIVNLCRVLMLNPELFLQREEVLMPDEAAVIDAYRSAPDGIRMSVRILLNVKEES